MRLRTVTVGAAVVGMLGALTAVTNGAAALDPDQLRPPAALPPQVVHVLTSAAHLVTVDPGSSGGAMNDVFITGIGPNETIVGVDIRPTTGALYAVTIDPTDTGRLYVVDPSTGAATKGPTITGAQLTGTRFAMDFSPTVDRLRIIGDDDQNVFVKPGDGSAVAESPEAYVLGDINTGANPSITGAGYVNPFAGARTTELYVVDSDLDALAHQSTTNPGQLSTVGPLGIDIGAANGFDVATSDIGYLVSSGTATSNGPGGGAYLFSVNLGTGGSTLVRQLPATIGDVVGMTLSQPGLRVPGAGPVIALAADGTLLQLSGPVQGLVSASTPITGLNAGDTIVGIDFRPANGQLYGLGRLSNLYVIDIATGFANLVNKTGPFTPALSGSGFGFDFNPVVDRIRVTSDTAQNLRLDPNIGVVSSEDAPEAYATGDANAGPGAITGAAYTNDVVGATTTQLYVIDSARSVLALQNPPNAGILNTVGPLGITVGSPDVGFDIVPGTDRALATIETPSPDVPNPTDGLYGIDLSNGAASLIGRLPVDVIDLAVPTDGLTGLGYHLVASDGGIFSYGLTGFAGSAGRLPLVAPIVGMAERPVGTGYWLVASDGGIFSYGTTGFFGSMGGRPLNSPIRGIVPHPSGDGYWLFASDGGVFGFGLARFHGSAGGLPLQRPIVAMAATPSGQGYWLFASDGGVFAYGDAAFWGSTGGTRLNQPIVGASAAPNGRGYYLVASDGGVFAFGPGTRFSGSTGSIKLNAPMVGIAADPDGVGYQLVANDGGVFAFEAAFTGSAGATPLVKPIVGIAAR